MRTSEVAQRESRKQSAASTILAVAVVFVAHSDHSVIISSFFSTVKEGNLAKMVAKMVSAFTSFISICRLGAQWVGYVQ